MFFTYMIFYGIEAASRSASLYVYNLLREQLLELITLIALFLSSGATLGSQ